MGLKPKTTTITKKEYTEAVAEAAKIRPKNYIKTFKEIDEVLEKDEPVKVDASKLDGRQKFKKWTFQELAKLRVTTENPRLLGCPNLLEMFTEILFYRWIGKKKKTGHVQATINQITVGLQLTEQEAQDVMLGDDAL